MPKSTVQVNGTTGGYTYFTLPTPFENNIYEVDRIYFEVQTSFGGEWSHLIMQGKNPTTDDWDDIAQSVNFKEYIKSTDRFVLYESSDMFKRGLDAMPGVTNIRIRGAKYMPEGETALLSVTYRYYDIWTGTTTVSSSTQQATVTSNEYFPSEYYDAIGWCKVTIPTAYSSDTQFFVYANDVKIGEGIFESGMTTSNTSIGTNTSDTRIAKKMLHDINQLKIVIQSSGVMLPTGTVSVSLAYDKSAQNHFRYYHLDGSKNFDWCTAWYYNGTSFERCDPKYYNGSAWKNCI